MPLAFELAKKLRKAPRKIAEEIVNSIGPIEGFEKLAAQPRFDYYCWDLYARVSHWYGEDKQNLHARVKTLHEIEQGGNQTAAIADMISVAVLRRHLETMDRFDIEYDFLPRESEIL